MRSNGEVNKYLDRKPAQSIDDARTFIQLIDANIQTNDSIYWAITLNGTDTLIGTICLFEFSEDDLKAEIGYELLPGFQGKGLMQEAVSTVINFGIEQIGLSSIEAYTKCENQSSTRVLEKCNFKMHGSSDDNLMIYKWARNK